MVTPSNRLYFAAINNDPVAFRKALEAGEPFTVSAQSLTRGIPKLRDQVNCPYVPRSKIGSHLLALYDISRVELSGGEGEYRPNSDDFGVVHNQLLVSGLGGDHFRDGIDNLKEIAKRLGIEIVKSFYLGPPRDVHFFGGDGKRFRLKPFDVENVSKASARVQFLMGCLETSGLARYPWNGWAGYLGKVNERQKIFPFFDSPEDAKALPYPGEGGNQFLVYNNEGKPVVLMGENTFTLSHHIYRLTPELKPEIKGKVSPENPPQVLREMYYQVLREMYYSGLIPINGKILNLTCQIFADLSLAHQMAHNQGMSLDTVTFRLLARKVVPNYTPNAAEVNKHMSGMQLYLGQQAQLRALMAKTLSVVEKNLCLLPSICAHVDYWCVPGPCNTVFIADYGLALEVLKIIDNQPWAFDLTDKDLYALKIYMNTLMKIHERVGPLVEKAKAKIEQAGLKAIPTPGFFPYDDPSVYRFEETEYNKVYPPEKLFTVNFMNAVTGWSEKTGQYYYICMGAKVGDRLGGLLMDAFAEFLKQYGSIELYYVGRSADKPDFEEAHVTFNNLILHGSGIHCQTYPLKTSGHKWERKEAAGVHAQRTGAGQVVQKVLEQWRVELPKTGPNAAPQTDDFGVIHKKIEIKRPRADGDWLRRGLVHILKELGVEVAFRDDGIDFPRDIHFLGKGGERLKFVSHTKNLDRVFRRSLIEEGYFGKTGYSQYPLQVLCSTAGLMHKEEKEIGGSGAPIQYLGEGGNQYRLINRDGKHVVLIGGNVLLHTHQYYRLEPTLKGRIAQPGKSRNVEKTLRKMHVMGLIRRDKYELNEMTLNAINFRFQMNLDTDSDRSFAECAQGIIPSFDMKPQEIAQKKPSADEFKGQREAVRKLIAENVGVSREDLHFLPSFLAHLDIFMQPGPNQSVFIPDFKMTTELLKRLQQDADLLQLTPDDRNQLEEYLRIAETCSQKMAPLMNKLKKHLEEAGLHPIPSPGLFLTDDAESRQFDHKNNVCFYNALTGWSPKTEKFYYICLGTKVCDQLGWVLMDVYAQFMRQYGDIDVYFLGHDPYNRENYSTTYLTNPFRSGGVHCMTRPIE